MDVAGSIRRLRQRPPDLRFRRRAIWKMSLIRLQILRRDAKKAVYFIYEALTLLGKDCGKSAKKHSIAHARNRHGEQAWP